MERDETLAVKLLLGEVTEILAPDELTWLVQEARRIEMRSKCLAEVPTGELDFAAMTIPGIPREG